MTSKLKCPFCSAELSKIDDTFFMACPDCDKLLIGTPQLWTALIQAKQDLEKSKERYSSREKKVLDWQMEVIVLNAKLKTAKSALRQIESRLAISPEIVARKALEQIEQKEEHDGVPL